MVVVLLASMIMVLADVGMDLSELVAYETCCGDCPTRGMFIRVRYYRNEQVE